MSELVIWNGAQWPVDMLPEGIKAADCTPIDEWFASQRNTSKTSASKPEGKRRAKKSTGS